jgi:hypothetical protein
VELGEIESPQMRVVDLWAGGVWLTTDDNSVFVPTFCRLIRECAERVRRRAVMPCPFPGRPPEEIFRCLEGDDSGFRERFQLMQWGETVDNLSHHAYLDGDLVLLFKFWRSAEPKRGHVARVLPNEFATALEQTVDLLSAGTDGPDGVRE